MRKILRRSVNPLPVMFVAVLALPWEASAQSRGTVDIRLNQRLSSGSSQPGDSFTGTLDEPLVAAEEGSDAATLDQVPRLLTRAEGEALVSLTVDLPVAGRRLDCSHLVHQILTAAGLTYPYATSSEIFAGIAQFQRVGTAQPGDLIVWPGHVGLVVDEGQRQFFSATRRGIRTDEYNKDYWRRRAHPRFYRYLVRKDTKANLLHHIASAE